MLGSRLKYLRERKGLSQRDLAKMIQVSSSTVAMYELNQRSPDNVTVIKLADFFNVSTDYLLGRTDITKGNEYGFVVAHGMPEMVCENRYNTNKNAGNIDPEVESANKIVKIEIDLSKNPSKEEILTSLKEGLIELAEEGHLTELQVKNIIKLMTKKIKNNEL